MITTIDRISGPAQTQAGQVGDVGVTPGNRPNSVPGVSGVAPPGASRSSVPSSFTSELLAAGKERDVNLSGHALRRLEQRQIDVGTDELDRLGRAMDMLAARGGRQSLVMLDQIAYVVHVPSHTVVTAVTPNDSKEAVFTQIDSVVIG